MGNMRSATVICGHGANLNLTKREWQKSWYCGQENRHGLVLWLHYGKYSSYHPLCWCNAVSLRCKHVNCPRWFVNGEQAEVKTPMPLMDQGVPTGKCDGVGNEPQRSITGRCRGWDGYAQRLWASPWPCFLWCWHVKESREDISSNWRPRFACFVQTSFFIRSF